MSTWHIRLHQIESYRPVECCSRKLLKKNHTLMLLRLKTRTLYHDFPFIFLPCFIQAANMELITKWNILKYRTRIESCGKISWKVADLIAALLINVVMNTDSIPRQSRFNTCSVNWDFIFFLFFLFSAFNITLLWYSHV